MTCIAYAILSKCLLFGSLTTVVYFRYQVFLYRNKSAKHFVPNSQYTPFIKTLSTRVMHFTFSFETNHANCSLAFLSSSGENIVTQFLQINYMFWPISIFLTILWESPPPPFTYHNHKYLCKVYSELFIFFFNLGTFSSLFIRKKNYFLLSLFSHECKRWGIILT